MAEYTNSKMHANALPLLIMGIIMMLMLLNRLPSDLSPQLSPPAPGLTPHSPRLTLQHPRHAPFDDDEASSGWVTR